MKHISFNTGTKHTHALSYLIAETHEPRLFSSITYDLGRLIITSCHPYFENSSPASKPFRHSFETQPATYLHTHSLIISHKILYQTLRRQHIQITTYHIPIHTQTFLSPPNNTKLISSHPEKNTYHRVESPRSIMRKHVCLIKYFPPTHKTLKTKLVNSTDRYPEKISTKSRNPRRGLTPHSTTT